MVGTRVHGIKAVVAATVAVARGKGVLDAARVEVGRGVWVADAGAVAVAVAGATGVADGAFWVRLAITVAADWVLIVLKVG